MREKSTPIFECILDELNSQLELGKVPILEKESLEKEKDENDIVGKIEDTEQKGNNKKMGEIGAVDWKKQATLLLHLLNFILEHKKGSRVNGEGRKDIKFGKFPFFSVV